MKNTCYPVLFLFFFLQMSFAGAQTIIYQKGVYQKKWTQRSVLSQPKGFRPQPEIYLTKKYIKSILKKFKNGASFVLTEEVYNRPNAVLGDKSDCQFVYTKAQMDEILAKSKGSVRGLERELYMKPGSLDRVRLMRIDVDDPKNYKLRMPTGNEPGVNDSWTPGGHYPNEYYQAVISRVPKSEVRATRIQ